MTACILCLHKLFVRGGEVTYVCNAVWLQTERHVSSPVAVIRISNLIDVQPKQALCFWEQSALKVCSLQGSI